MVLAVPAFDRPLIRVKLWKKPDYRPDTLLKLYLVIAGVFILLIAIIPIQFVDHISDLPNLISKNYSQTNPTDIRTVEKHYSTKGPHELSITTNNGTQLRMVQDAFEPINADEKYTFFYLSRTKWVMDIIDENGVSILKNQR